MKTVRFPQQSPGTVFEGLRPQERDTARSTLPLGKKNADGLVAELQCEDVKLALSVNGPWIVHAEGSASGDDALATMIGPAVADAIPPGDPIGLGSSIFR
tara:strand:- start:418 stop:717 length:300 start_codon:yes stop_codon:yes gene_type:complete